MCVLERICTYRKGKKINGGTYHERKNSKTD
nr:MAG TPA: hypothetical protein [Caudoviricetes sp.]